MPHSIKPVLGSILNHGPYRLGLIGCWVFNEGGGNKIVDLTHNHPDGTIPSGWSWAGGKFGPALLGDDTNYTTFTENLIQAYPFTLYIIAQNGSTGGDATSSSALSVGEPTYWGNYHEIRIVSYNTTTFTAYAWSYTNGATQKQISGSGVGGLDTHHVAYVCEAAASKKLYIDGELKTADTTSVPFDDSLDGLRIGARCGSGNDNPLYTTCRLSLAMVYNRGLTAAEILRFYQEALR